MPTYLYCDLRIFSNILIPELLPSAADTPELVFHLKKHKIQTGDPPWSYDWTSPAGEPFLSYCWEGGYHWMRFPRLADFQVSAHASEIFCYPFSDLPEETIRHLLIDQVLPRCLAHRGRIMVHASAVRIDDGAILFLGDSGSGKSTLAANFHQAGQRALSDDCIWMREHGRAVEVVPSYGGVRLWEDSLDVLFPSQATEPMAHYSAKKRISLETENSPASSIWLKVLALFVLAVPNPNAKPQINIQLLAKREAFIALVKQCFQLDVMDVKRVERQMDTIGRMIPFLPAFHLTIPHDYDLLPQVRQKILEAVL